MTFRRTVVMLVVIVVAIALGATWNVLAAWPVPAGYSFPRHSLFAGEDALFEGTLKNVDGCIRAEGNGSFAVVWPPGYWLTLEDGEPIVHGLAREAEMGEPVRMGGGYYETGGPPPDSRDIGDCAPPFFMSTGLTD